MKKIYTVISVLFVFVLYSIPAWSQYTGPTPTVTPCAYHDVSPPLKDIVPHPSLPKATDIEDSELPDVITPPKAGALPIGEDPAWQKENGSKGTVNPYRNFQALQNSDNSSGVAPPDSDGDISPDYYFAMVNNVFQIFNRSGSSVYGPAGNTTIWDGWGGYSGQSISDPIVLWDEQAERWFASVFVTTTISGYYRILVAVSTTSSPLGTWNRYYWEFSSKPDYPKYGIWPDGYYLGINRTGDDVLVLERSAMIAGTTADMVSFDNPGKPVPNNTTFNCVLPSDCDGAFPPYGTPNYFWGIGDDAWAAYSYDRLLVWEFHVDWTTPTNSTWTGPTAIATSAFDATFNAFGVGEITQPGTSQVLDCIPWVLMFRPQFRNFGSHYSLVCNHSVDVNGANQAGVRWYELRKTTGSWYIRQQGTYSPDGDNRWMGSIAMNAQGDIALGYSVSSTTTYPSIRFTGRLAEDPLNTMTFTESNIYSGSYSQTDSRRWGDYSMMSVDPLNDHSFWYISEYADNYGGWADWTTQVAAFTLDDYCYALGNCNEGSSSYEYISNVNIGSINNSSTCSRYSDYTDLSTNILNTSSAPMTVSVGNYYSGDDVSVWVDWNKDEDFEDANEFIGTDASPPYEFTIDPPAGTANGSCRMRVRLSYSATPVPCGITSFGEVEDYTINVTGPNTWVGTFNHYWHQAANWSNGHIPLATEDVSIPNTGFQPVYVDDYPAYTYENCEDLTIAAGASIEVRNMGLVVNSNLTVNGEITMIEDGGYITVYGNTIWNSGSTFDATAYNTFINAYGSWNFESGSNFTPSTGFVDFEGSSLSWLRCYSSTSHFYNLRIYKTGSAAAQMSNLCTEDLIVNGLTFIGPNAAFNSLSNHNVVMNGAFNYYGTFDFTLNSNTGSAVFDGATQTINNYSSGSGLFNNVVFSSSTGATVSGGAINVAGNLTINEGYFSPGVNIVSVGGDWTNTVGDAGFSETGTHVIINGGNYHQYCSTESFGLLEIDKASGGAFRVNTGTVICDQYDWTAGAVDVNTGTFTANDLLDNRVTGAFYVNPGGTINLINPAPDTYVDLQGELHNYGGTINITGSLSYWPYMGDALVEMSGGVIDLTSCGLVLFNSYNLTTNITGGTIRMNGGFTGSRSDFTPTSGTIELYGTNVANILQLNGCTVYDLIIDKSSKSNGAGQKSIIIPNDERKDPTINYNSDDNFASLSTDIVVTGGLNINSGSLRINGNQLDVAGDINVSGNLIMDNVADVINGGNEIYWNSGATEQMSAGTINLDYRMVFNDGSNVQIGPGNTLNLIGTGTTAIRNYSSVAEIGSMNVAMPPSSGTCFISYTTTFPVVITGDLNVNTDNYFHLQEYDLYVNGNMVIASGATVELGSILGPGFLEVGGTLTNNGTLLVDYDETTKTSGSGTEDESLGKTPLAGNSESLQKSSGENTDWFAGEAYVHGHFTQSTTGTTSILGGGTFICDEPTTSLVSVVGHLNLDDGIFEISNNHLQLNAVCAINGGIIRSGGTFWATIDGNFQPTGGVVELIGNGGTGQYIQVHANNYFHDLTINRTNTIMIYTGYNLNVKNDFSILSGGLNTNTRDMYVGGDWYNQAGTAAFLESTGKVVFNGPGPEMQYIKSDETFNILENNTFEAIRVNSAEDDVVCNSYNWISGNVSVSQGSFTANDLAQSGLYGGWYALTDGEIYLNQDLSSYVDVFGSEIYVYGGMMKVTGGQDESYWCLGDPLNLTITGGGILDFDGYGITIWNNAALTYNLSGGTLKTSGWFACYRTDFNPAGIVEFYGGTDSQIDVAAGSSFNDLRINKSGGLKTTYTFTDRDGKSQTGSKSNTAYLLNNDLNVEGNLIIDEGTMDINGYIMNVYGDANINTDGILLLEDNATLAFDGGSQLHVNNGGWLLTVATPANDALITNISTGYYDLWIEDGGYISAENTIFEYTSNAGVYLRSGSMVNPVYSFNNCTFQNGIPGGNMMSIYSDQTFSVNNAVFPTNTWGGAYNVFKNVMTGNVYFNDATGDFAGSDFEFDPYNKVFWGDEILRLDLTVYLEGPYQTGGIMSTNLNTNGYLPLSHPYAPSMPYYDMTDPGDIPWYYTGPGTVSSIPPNVVDWVIVELRDATTPANATSATTIGTKAAFLLDDGSIVDLDGFSTLNFDVIFTNNLYAVVFHRNHLGVMSSTGLTQTGGIYTYDFSTGASQAYGGSNGHKEMEPGIWGMVAADGNGNGLIQNTDETAVWKIDLGNSGYMGGDFEMTGLTQNTDETNYWKPNLGGGGQVPSKSGTGYVSQVPK